MSVPDIPNSKKVTFQMLVMITDHHGSLGCVLKIETPNSPNLSLTISDCRQY